MGTPLSNDRKNARLASIARGLAARARIQAAPVALESAKPTQKFLQQGGAAAGASEEWTTSDEVVVRRAMRAATLFMQAHHTETYMPAYGAQSGQILGVLKQLKDDMEARAQH